MNAHFKRDQVWLSMRHNTARAALTIILSTFASTAYAKDPSAVNSVAAKEINISIPPNDMISLLYRIRLIFYKRLLIEEIGSNKPRLASLIGARQSNVIRDGTGRETIHFGNFISAASFPDWKSGRLEPLLATFSKSRISGHDQYNFELFIQGNFKGPFVSDVKRIFGPNSRQSISLFPSLSEMYRPSFTITYESNLHAGDVLTFVFDKKSMSMISASIKE